MTPPLLKVTDLMERLQVSRPTAYRIVKSGRIAVVRVGGTTRITEDALAEYVTRQTTPATPDRPRRGRPRAAA